MFTNAIAVVGFAAMVSGRAIVARQETLIDTPTGIIETPIPTFITPLPFTPTISETPIEIPTETPIEIITTSLPVIIETPTTSLPVVIETPIETPVPSQTPTPGMPSGPMMGPCKMEGMWNCIDGTTFQRCASGFWSVVQPVAPGTQCTKGHSMELDIQHGSAPVPTPIGGAPGPVETPLPGTTPGSPAGSLAGVCDNEGEWNCINGSAFQRCASGAWSMALPMAAGTKCTKGRTMDFQMIPTHSFMHRKRRVVV